MNAIIKKGGKVEISVYLNDFKLEDILDYIEDEVILEYEDKRRLLKIVFSTKETEISIHLNNLDDIHKVELFEERWRNIPIAEFLEFFNRYK